MNMLRLLNTAVFLILIYIGVSAKPIIITVNYSQFKFDSSTTLVELYYSFPDTALVYKHIGKKLSCELQCSLNIYNNLGVVDKRTWIVEKVFENDSDALHQRSDLIGIQKIYLMPGQYKFSMNFIDLTDNTKKDSLKFDLNVKDFISSKMQLSDIQLSQHISQYDSTTNMYSQKYIKSELVVLPLPTDAYVGTSPVLYAFTEIYNLKSTFKLDSFQIKYIILDNTKKEVFDVVYQRPIVSNDQIDVLQLPVDVLNSGVYFLKQILPITRNGIIDSLVNLKKFYLLNPDLPAEQSTLLSEDEMFLRSEFSTISEKRIDDMFAMTKFVASVNEVDTYTQLTSLSAKQKFLYRFWSQRDPNPATQVNERYEEFKKAVDYAKRNYKSSLNPQGWNSDRGKILLKYGFPTQIDRKYFSSRMDSVQTYPYEIWYYDNIQGGAIFAFVDMRGLENFAQVHSTALGEVNQPNWFNLYAVKHNSDTEINKTKGGNFNLGR